MRSAVVPVVILGACALASGALLAQGPRNIQPLALEDRAGFEPMFDGTSLAGWEGDTGFWRVEGGLLVGESTAAKPLPANTFLIWTKAQPADFELKMDFRITRRQHRRPVPQRARARRRPVRAQGLSGRHRLRQPVDRSALRGARPRLPGAARPGDVQPRRQAAIFGSPTPADALKAAINIGGWNTIHIIARDDLVVHAINGKVSAVFLDGDKAKRPSKGFIGLQLHTGPPMRAEFRNLAIRTID